MEEHQQQKDIRMLSLVKFLKFSTIFRAAQFSRKQTGVTAVEERSGQEVDPHQS